MSIKVKGLIVCATSSLACPPEQLTIEAPAVAVVEAKEDDLKSGLGQCMAEMVASRLFNKQKGRELIRV